MAVFLDPTSFSESSVLSHPTPRSSMKSSSTLPQPVIEVGQPLSESHGVDWLGLLPAFIAAGVAVVGWTIVERFAREREKRADLRALTTSFREAIDDILVDAAKYYSISGNAPEALSLASSIKSKLALLSEQMTVLTEANLLPTGNDYMKSFRKAVTGGDFESATRVASSSGSEVFVVAASAGATLHRAVQLSLYRELLRRRNWLKRRN